MAHLTETTDWRFGITHSRMLAMIWSADARHARTQRAKLAYAQQLGKPIRLVCLGTTRLPEDLCAGYGDVQVARVGDQAEAGRQIQVWLAELDAREAADA
jgi:hypothetical protein